MGRLQDGQEAYLMHLLRGARAPCTHPLGGYHTALQTEASGCCPLFLQHPMTWEKQRGKPQDRLLGEVPE